MSLEFQSLTHFEASPERIFAVMTDLDAAAEWMPNIVSIERLDGDGFGVGTQWRETRKMFGKEATELFEVKHCDAARALDIYVDGRATAYGYTIPGGLVQYHLIGKEIFEADGGSGYLIPVADNVGYASAALSEPWACVEGSYMQRRRLDPGEGGTMLIVGSSDDETAYTSSAGLGSPAKVVLSSVSDTVRALVAEHLPNAEVIDDDAFDAASVPGGQHRRTVAFGVGGEHRLGAGHLESATVFHVQGGHHAVLDDHGVALGAQAEASALEVQLQAHGLGEVCAAIGQH